MPSANRPLSPHLQVYRLQMTSGLSILHRLTGVVLALGLLLLVYWLLAAAAGPQAFAAAQGFMGSWLGRLVLFGWTFALVYHLCNGLRHLAWDAGRGFEIRTATRTGWLVLAASGALTLAVWIAAYAVMGAGS